MCSSQGKSAALTSYEQSWGAVTLLEKKRKEKRREERRGEERKRKEKKRKEKKRKRKRKRKKKRNQKKAQAKRRCGSIRVRKRTDQPVVLLPAFMRGNPCCPMSWRLKRDRSCVLSDNIITQEFCIMGRLHGGCQNWEVSACTKRSVGACSGQNCNGEFRMSGLEHITVQAIEYTFKKRTACYLYDMPIIMLKSLLK